MIGDTLKHIRGIYGYKASELCEMLGISSSYLSEIENNKKQPSLELLQKCADIYGLKLSSLIILSESYEEVAAKSPGTAKIRSLMMNLITRLSAASQEANESSD